MFVKIISVGESLYECDSVNWITNDQGMILNIQKDQKVVAEWTVDPFEMDVYIMNGSGRTIEAHTRRQRAEQASRAA